MGVFAEPVDPGGGLTIKVAAMSFGTGVVPPGS
jgi:hypothetical protein